MIFRGAKPGDLSWMLDLLCRSNLPTEGVEDHLHGFFIGEVAGAGVGLVGVEQYGSSGLLRSLAVDPAHRRKGLATQLCRRLETDAAERGVEHLYLLTETAESFFAARGYAPLPRSLAPPEIAANRQFTSLCPDSAVFMIKSIHR